MVLQKIEQLGKFKISFIVDYSQTEGLTNIISIDIIDKNNLVYDFSKQVVDLMYQELDDWIEEIDWYKIFLDKKYEYETES